MASYHDQIALAYNEGFSHADLQEHHAIQEWGNAPRPPIERAWDNSPILPEEDWLQSFGPRPNAPSLDEGAPSAPMTPPSPYVTDQSGSNPWINAGNAADQTAPGIALPGTQDVDVSGSQAPWEVPNTNSGETGILNLATSPNAGPDQEI